MKFINSNLLLQHYEKCLKKVARFVVEQNEQVWTKRGLLITDPIERGLRVIEISILTEPAQQLPSSTNLVLSLGLRNNKRRWIGSIKKALRVPFCFLRPPTTSLNTSTTLFQARAGFPTSNPMLPLIY